MLKLFNTLTRKKQAFKPIKEGEVKMYVCGPTVNDVPHLGHAKSQISFDVLRKYLIFSGYKVKFVSNITDIDDKIINKANDLGESIETLTKRNTEAHIEDYKKLGVDLPDIRTKATEYVKQMIELVQLLEKKGYTYRIEGDGIYYNISKFKEYGKLSHQDTKDLKAGARVKANDEKKNKEDFVLWKLSKPGEPSWESPWGAGRPGWHIECSAMTHSVLGLPFDIHGGGQDLIFPHHEDEIAQSEAGYGKKFANYWIHNGMVNVDKVKMSKSLGNFKTIRDLLKEYPGMVLRYFVLSSQYRQPADFSKQLLEDAKTTYQRMKNIIAEIKDDNKVNEKALKDFKKAMDDDLNTPKALAILWTLLRDEKAKGKIGAIKEMDKVLGLKLLEKEEIDIPEDIQTLLNQRQEARKSKNWSLSDQLRDKIKQKGFIVEDKSDGQKITKA